MTGQQAALQSELASASGDREGAIADPTLGWDLMDEPTIAPSQVEESAEIAPLGGVEVVEPQQASSPPQPSNPNFAIDSIENLFGESETDLSSEPGRAMTDGSDVDRDEITALTDLFGSEDDPVLPSREETRVIDWDQPDQGNSSNPLLAGEQRQPVGGAASQDLDPTLGWDDDRYIPASPEEDLLPANESVETGRGIWLDEMTLNRLNQDLSSLENPIDNQPAEATTIDWMLPDFPEEVAQTDATATTAPTGWSEGTLDDFVIGLGEESAANPSELPAAPAEVDTPFTLENITSLFGDLSDPHPPSPLPSSNPSTEQSAPFSLEGMDDLFGDDVPFPVVTPAPVADPLASQSNFPLEGVDDLFADIPAVAATPVPPPADPVPLPDQPLAFTLEGMDDLFSDVPSTAAPSSSSGSQSPIAPAEEDLTDFSLEAMFDLFGDAPAIPEQTPGQSQPSQRQTQAGELPEYRRNQNQSAETEVQFPEKKTEMP